MHADPIKGAADVPLNDVLQRTGGGGQLNHQAGARAAQDELLHHLQGDDVLAELGLLHGAERLHHRRLVDLGHTPSLNMSLKPLVSGPESCSGWGRLHSPTSYPATPFDPAPRGSYALHVLMLRSDARSALWR